MNIPNVPNKIYIPFCLFVFISTAIFSQSLVEIPLTVNPVLTAIQSNKKSLEEHKSASIYDTISLVPLKGILDDFSYDSPYPDTAIWLDNNVFINRGYGKAPVTIGVATFEGLDANGYPYNFSASASSSIAADTLTSKPIRLNYLAGDSVYFSFFYQPQGFGNAPEYSDSLIVEFKAVDTSSIWQQVWYQNGSQLAAEDSTWSLVMLSITDTAFLKEGFQFRFRNYATINGNLDHWHLDYVYLNKGRSAVDTVFNDVSWVYNGVSLLENYQSMPWKQFQPSELKLDLVNLIRNNYATTQNVNYDYIITDDTAQSTIGTFTGSVNILPFDTSFVYTNCDVSLGCIDSVPNAVGGFPSSLSGPTHFTIKHFFANTVGDLNYNNDTLIVSNEINNYFAYDDGTAENAVGLNRFGAQLAEKYELNVGDTLQAIDIYFNPIESNAALYSFALNVWNDNGGEPGTAIYTSSSVLTPTYEQVGQNKFTRYLLEPPLYLDASTFYIGFTQNTDQFLNVGEDKNINTDEKTMFNFGDEWLTSTLGGSLMMHPLFGVKSEFVGTEDVVAAKENKTTVYPNPVSDLLYIQTSNNLSSQSINYTIVDLYGRVVVQSKIYVDNFIDVSALTEGVYIIRIEENNYISTNKFVKLN